MMISMEACDHCTKAMEASGHPRTTRPKCKRPDCASPANWHSVYCCYGCRRVHRVEVWLKTGETGAAVPGEFIREFILIEQDQRCAICGIPNVWMGSPLILILDHINGDSLNNQRSNLRLVCSNCDSQLPTYKARNRGNGRYLRRERYASGKSY